jgi:uncharacterized protein (TIGR03000 family)
MYGMVLMAALTTGGNVADWHGCCGCWGGGYGCWGCWGGSGCYGCWGSGCYGCWGSGCYGCWGSGCYGGYGGYAWAPGVYGPVIASNRDGTLIPQLNGQAKGTSAAKARLIVELPAEAKLFIDDQQMKTTASPRTFNTPPLERGQQYYYILRAEVVRDGKPRTESKRVIVRAGQEVRASFSEMGAAAVTASR